MPFIGGIGVLKLSFIPMIVLLSSSPESDLSAAGCLLRFYTLLILPLLLLTPPRFMIEEMDMEREAWLGSSFIGVISLWW